MTDFDFGSIKVEDGAELPKRKSPAKETGPNPFAVPLADSYNKSAGKSFVLPNVRVVDAVNLLRRASQQLGIGVRIVVTGPDVNDVVERNTAENLATDRRWSVAHPPNKNLTIRFLGKERAKRGTKETTADADE